MVCVKERRELSSAARTVAEPDLGGGRAPCVDVAEEGRHRLVERPGAALERSLWAHRAKLGSAVTANHQARSTKSCCPHCTMCGRAGRSGAQRAGCPESCGVCSTARGSAHMLAECEIPEAAADLIATLADLHRDHLPHHQTQLREWLASSCGRSSRLPRFLPKINSQTVYNTKGTRAHTHRELDG